MTQRASHPTTAGLHREPSGSVPRPACQRRLAAAVWPGAPGSHSQPPQRLWNGLTPTSTNARWFRHTLARTPKIRIAVDTRLTLTSLLFSAIMKCTRPPGPLDCHSCHSPNSPKLRRYSTTQKRHVGNDKGSFSTMCHCSRMVNHHIHGDLQCVLMPHHHHPERVSHQQDIHTSTIKQSCHGEFIRSQHCDSFATTLHAFEIRDPYRHQHTHS